MSEAQQSKATRLVITQVGTDANGNEVKMRQTLFLSLTNSSGEPVKNPYFYAPNGGKVRGFLVRDKAGEYTGAIRLAVPAASEGGESLMIGMLYKKEGEHGVFYSGYTAPFVELEREEGQQYAEYAYAGGLEVDEEGEGRFTNAHDVTAFIDGPDAAFINDKLPVVSRKPKGNRPGM
jgi:hypothetical protein